MSKLKAIFFDFFNTLVGANIPCSLKISTLYESIKHDFKLDCHLTEFSKAYDNLETKYRKKAYATYIETDCCLIVEECLSYLGVSNNQLIHKQIFISITRGYNKLLSQYYLIPGAREILETLSYAYPIGLISNSSFPWVTKRVLQVYGLDRYFNSILISGDIGIRKPHPTVFWEALNRFGLDPNEAMMVSDGKNDIMGARKIGMPTILFAKGSNDRSSVATYTIKNLFDLPILLDSHRKRYSK